MYKRFERILSVILIFTLCLTVTPVPVFADDIASGVTGSDNVPWRVTEDGELIVGDGGEYTLDSGMSPGDWNWEANKADIISVSFQGTIIANDSIRAMFDMYGALTSVDFTGLDTSGTTDMGYLFAGCENLESITFGNTFDTSLVEDMGDMFYQCSSLIELDLSGFNMSAVTIADGMLDLRNGSGDFALTTLILGENDILDASGSGGINTWFGNNTGRAWNSERGDLYIDSADLAAGFDADPTARAGKYTTVFDSGVYDNVNWIITRTGDLLIGSPDTEQTFDYDDDRTDVPWDWNSDVTPVNREKVTNEIRFINTVYGNGAHDYMFSDLWAVKADLTNFRTDNVESMRGMFDSCKYLTEVSMNGLNSANVTDMSFMFARCDVLQDLDLRGLDTSGAKDLSYMFYGCKALTSVDVSGWNTSAAEDMRGMFTDCDSLTALDLSDWETDNVTDMSDMFLSCTNLASIDMTGWETGNVTDMAALFEGCTALTSVDVSHFHTGNVTDMHEMFMGTGVTSLDLSTFDTSNVEDMHGMFTDCDALKSVDMTGWNVDKVDNTYEMFKGCTSLETLDVSAFKLDAAIIQGMLEDLSSLKTITFGQNSVLELTGFDTNTGFWAAGSDLTTAYEVADFITYFDALSGEAKADTYYLVYQVELVPGEGTGTAAVEYVKAIDPDYTLPAVSGSFSAPDGKLFDTWEYDGANHEEGDVITIVLADPMDVAKVTALWFDPTVVLVVVDDVTKTYGEADPAFTVTVTPESAADAITYSVDRETGENAGTYIITASGDAVQGIYTITYETGKLTIAQKAVTVTADNKAIQIGSAMPEFTVQMNGVLEGEEGQIAYTATTTAADTNTVGDYDITLGGDAMQGNYTVTFVPGTLTISLLPVAVWTAEPAAKTGLTYNGAALEFVTAGETEQGTPVYSLDGGTTWQEELPAGTGAGDYTITYKIEGTAGIYADSAAVNVGVSIVKAAASITASNLSVTQGKAAPALTDADYTITGLIGGDTLANDIWLYYGPDAANPIAADAVDTSAAGTTYNIGIELDTPNQNYDITVTPGRLTVDSAEAVPDEDSSERRSNSYEQEDASYDFTQPEEGVGAGVEDAKVWTWGERANLSEDSATLYMVLSNNAISEEEETPLPYPEIGTDHFLATDDIWTLPTEDHGGHSYKVVSVQVCEDHEPKYFGNGDGKVDENSFGKSDFFTVGVGTGDMTIDYPNLTTGDVVSNKTFNGVFVTKLQKSNNPTFDADLAKLKSDAFASFRTFEFDHPEVFWLTGDVKLRAMTVTIDGVQTAYLFMVLVDDTGFTMRIPEYAAPGAIEAAIAQRDAAVAAIIAQIPAGASTREKIANLNKWFTLHNEYNRSADLNSIGCTPHRSLKALVGSEGTDGPVCDGYSRGFKTVCDRLGIPVILDTGVASIGAHSEYHMWMRVQVDGAWYGLDCTWNDPIMEGVSGKISGYENEQYLLVGEDTVVNGEKFGISHPVNTTAGGTTGVLFATLMVNAGEIDGYLPLDFEDVRLADWFYDYVKSAASLGLMGGVADRVFSPQTTATRGQIVQILYNAAGQPAVGEVKVDGWFGKAATWAMEKGIVAGYADGQFHGNDSVTREQLATILWAYEGAAAQEGELDFADAARVSDYAVQALLWAKKEGIIGGKPGNLADPQGTATRAEIATIFSNYMK